MSRLRDRLWSLLLKLQANRLKGQFCMSRCAVIWIVLAIVCGMPFPEVHSADSWTFLISAGDVDRSHLPLKAVVEIDPLHASRRVKVSLPDGSSVTGQFISDPQFSHAVPASKSTVRGTILFILPKLISCESIELKAQLVPDEPTVPAAVEKGLRWTSDNGSAKLLLGGKMLVEYVMPLYDASTEETRVQTYKPFHHVYDSRSGIRLTKGDGGQYTHHRGIFFGYNKIGHGTDSKMVSDTWHCKDKARQEHREVLEQIAGPIEARQCVRIEWTGGDASLLASETRELDIVPLSAGTMIDFSSRLVTLAGPMRLEGDPQHAGVHFRAAQEVAETTKTQTYYLRPGVKAEPGEFRNWPEDKTFINAAWHAAIFVVGGQRYSVLRINTQRNPGEARMSERDYARFGSYFEFELLPEKPLEVFYRWWIQPGELSLEEATRIAADWATPAKIVVTPSVDASILNSN